MLPKGGGRNCGEVSRLLWMQDASGNGELILFVKRLKLLLAGTPALH